MERTNFLGRIAALAGLAMITAAPLKAQLVSGSLDTNNIRYSVYSDGSGYDGTINPWPQFQVPKNSSTTTMFTSNLWLGGVDNSGQLHMAAQTYKQAGTDFWPGPISPSTGNAANPASWNNVWKVNKSTIDYHIANYNNLGYVVPAEIASWPGNGPAGFAPVMAPFMDMNGNSIYEPSLGDYPYILGDQALYFIFNDKYSTHSETGGQALGVEIHGMAYSFNDPNDTALSNTVFVRYSIANRNSAIDWNNLYMGLWTDFDIGMYNDDFIGSDSLLNMYYGYNGEPFDQSSSTPAPGEYGANPPVQAVVFLSHPMSHSMYYNNDFTVQGNPSTADEYYRYMKSIWKDSSPLTYSGDGYASSSSQVNHVYTGDPATSSGWTEATAGNTFGDRRMLGTAGPLTVPAGNSLNFDIAYVYSRSNAPYPAGNIKIKTDVSHIQTYYNNNIATVGVKDVKNEAKSIGIYPNPAGDHATLHFANADHEAYTLRMFDATGKIVKEDQNITTSQVSVDCSEMAKGIYFVVVQGSQKMFTGKLIVE